MEEDFNDAQYTQLVSIMATALNKIITSYKNKTKGTKLF